DDRRTTRSVADADGVDRSAQGAGQRAHAHVPRDLRASADPHSARESDRRDDAHRRDGPWQTRERTAGSAVTSRLWRRIDPVAGWAAFVVAVGLVSAQTPPPQQQTPAQQPPPAGQTPQRPQPSFRAGVDLVSLNVTVSDGTRYVTDLSAEDFNVFEDG